MLLLLLLLSVNSFSLLSKTTIPPSVITALCPFRLPVRLFRVSSTVFTLPGVFDPFSYSFPPAYPVLSHPISSAYPPAAFASPASLPFALWHRRITTSKEENISPPYQVITIEVCYCLSQRYCEVNSEG
ncbi:hypothetical protein DER46DRAFT_617523 [Fusarium sp. MPI-SDFR-AT-0072]|nr:hypothetical protein DER46DRAFT_617523 [Fusarium sp. MPI-SDFR-AT-0072]